MIGEMTAGGATAGQMPLPSTTLADPVAVSKAIRAFLTEHADVDGVLIIFAGQGPGQVHAGAAGFVSGSA